MLSMMKLLGYYLTLNICSDAIVNLDNITPKLYKTEFYKLTKKYPYNISHAQFSNKGTESINLPSLFNNSDVTSTINSFINLPTPKVVCNLPKPTRSTIFSFNKVTSGVNINEFRSGPNYF